MRSRRGRSRRGTGSASSMTRTSRSRRSREIAARAATERASCYRMSRTTQDVSPFGTWNGLDSFELFPGVRLHAIGGDQVLLCRVSYDPGKSVVRHAHEHTEQVMYSEGCVTFFEALAPVPLDHVPDRERDLVLVADGGSQHGER